MDPVELAALAKVDITGDGPLLDTIETIGQMIDDIRLVSAGRVPVSFYGRTGGIIPTPAEVLAKIVELNEEAGE